MICPSKSAPLELAHRKTPTPGPNDILIEVKAIAINPVDVYMRDWGLFIKDYPATIGFDVAGKVVAVGSSVPTNAPQPGTRVTAYATPIHKQGNPDYGAFQTHVLVPATNVTPLPDTISFTEASLLPMATYTPMAGWYQLGLPQVTTPIHTDADKKGMLIWGGSSSIGSMAVQMANVMGFKVYATSSTRHHQYLKELGAHKVFDYQKESVVQDIVKAAKEEGITLDQCFQAVNPARKECLAILKEFKVDGKATIASAIPLEREEGEEEGVEIKFVQGPSDASEMTKWFSYVFNVWLKEKLATGAVVPSPHIRVVDGGLQAINKALDILKEGVSGTKIVLEL